MEQIKENNNKDLLKVICNIPYNGKIKLPEYIRNENAKKTETFEIELIPLEDEYFFKVYFALVEMSKTAATTLAVEAKETEEEETKVYHYLEVLKQIIVSGVSVNWFEPIPRLVKILTDGYKLGLTEKQVAKIPMLKKIEFLYMQYHCEIKGSEVAQEFLQNLVKKNLPGLNNIILLAERITYLVVMALTATGSSAQSPKNLTATPKKSGKTTRGQK
ncbi:MAG: hypothetical protein AB1706_10165 [Pseudomonadota bacterium]